MGNVYFISDLHILHKSILKYSKNRVEYMNLKDENDIKGHAEWIIDMWLKQTSRGDHIYVLGDFIFGNKIEESIKVLNKLKSNGCQIHLIVGNHDNDINSLKNMFTSINLIKVVNFKKKNFPFLEEDLFQCILCHYPLKSWFNKCKGSLNVYGHVHDMSPWIDKGDDLCLNVGFDTELSNFSLIPLEKLYKAYKEKLNGMTPKEYIEYVSSKNETFIR